MQALSELVATSTQEFDWTQCKSEGGTKNCARCSGDGNGALPCDKVLVGSHKASECPDHEFWRGKLFMQTASSATGRCYPVGASKQLASFQGNPLTSRVFPIVNQSQAGNGSNAVITKMLVAHPDHASEDVGVFVFKRLVTHICTGAKPGACEQGEIAVDVMKVSARGT